MRHLSISFLLVSVLLPFASGGCKKSARPESPPLAPATNAAASKPVEPVPAPVQNVPLPQAELLKVKWPVGTRYIYRFELEQHSTNTVPSTPQPSIEDLALGVTYALSVVAETSEGGRELEIEFLANDLEIKMGGQVVIHFDSALSVTNESAHPVPPPFRRMIGSKTLLRTQADGTVEKVLGLDTWLKSVAGEASGPAGQMVVQQFNENFFRQTADFGRGLSPNPVRPGDSWKFQTEVPAGDLGSIRLDSTIQLTGWKEVEQHRFAVLEAKGILSSIPALTSPLPRLALEQGKVQSRAWFDFEAGALNESIFEQSLRVQGPLPETPGNKTDGTNSTTFASDLAQKVTVKLVELAKSQPAEREKIAGELPASK